MPYAIALPTRGETFNDPTLEAFTERLLALRPLGYRFPHEELEVLQFPVSVLRSMREPQKARYAR